MFLALFPLQLALFPGEHVPLHIFEPRYKQLISECRDEGMTFGIPAFVAGNLSVYGTEVELAQILETHPNGEMDIVVRGIRVFKILELQRDVPDKLYSAATIEFVVDHPESTPDLEKELTARFAEFMRLIRKSSRALEQESENTGLNRLFKKPERA